MVVLYGGKFIGKFRIVIIIRGGVIARGRSCVQCFTFIRNAGGAASCLVEGGGQQKGMRS